MPSPYDTHRPTTTLASCAAPRSSRASRDFPMPGGPTTVTSSQRRSARARASAACRALSSPARPTNGPLIGCVNAGASSSSSTRRQAATAACLPFTASGGTGSARTASRTRANVSSPMRTSPGPAVCSSRAATLTASPVTSCCRRSASPATTSPVFTPILTASGSRPSARSSALSRATALPISAAARTARSASSSWRRGRPKTAITASPMNFSTVPPCRSSTWRTPSK
jgi:hypothetical protein